jgi:hypothetical protein
VEHLDREGERIRVLIEQELVPRVDLRPRPELIHGAAIQETACDVDFGGRGFPDGDLNFRSQASQWDSLRISETSQDA